MIIATNSLQREMCAVIPDWFWFYCLMLILSLPLLHPRTCPSTIVDNFPVSVRLIITWKRSLTGSKSFTLLYVRPKVIDLLKQRRQTPHSSIEVKSAPSSPTIYGSQNELPSFTLFFELPPCEMKIHGRGAGSSSRI